MNVSILHDHIQLIFQFSHIKTQTQFKNLITQILYTLKNLKKSTFNNLVAITILNDVKIIVINPITTQVTKSIGPQKILKYLGFKP